MSQSEIIAGALLGGFVLWLLLTNRLQTYWALLTGGGASAAQAATDAASATAPAVTSTTPPPSGTSTANVQSFVDGTVQTFGNTWVWKDALSGATRIDTKPPPGYTPPSATPPATTPPATTTQ